MAAGCSCDRLDHYEEVFSGDTETELEVHDLWEPFFSFNGGRAYRSLVDRVPLHSPAYLDEEHRYEWAHAVAETLFIGLDIDEIEVKYKDEVSIKAPGDVSEDVDIVSPLAETLYEDRRDDESFFTELRVRGKEGFLCESCKKEVELFLNKADQLWREGYVKATEVYDEEGWRNVKESEGRLKQRYAVQDHKLEEKLSELGLLQAGVSDTLSTINETILGKVFSGIQRIGPEVAAGLFNKLFGISQEQSASNDRGYIDPWTFKVVHIKNRSGESGFGYTLTERQLKYLYDMISSIMLSEETRCKIGGLIDVDKDDLDNIWGRSVSAGEIYTESEHIENEVINRTVETVWNLQKYDGFIREDNGFMRVPKNSGVAVYADKDTYEPLVDDSPISKFESTFIHKEWIVEVPIYEKDSVLSTGRNGQDDKFKGVVWIMSNLPIPPAVRLIFLDSVRELEHTITKLTERFLTTTSQMEERIRERQKRKESWLGAHRQRYIRGMLDDARNKLSHLDNVEDDVLKNIETARFLSRRFSGNTDPKNIKSKLSVSVRSIYRSQIYAEPDLDIEIKYMPNSSEFTRYLIDSVSSLAENSSRHTPLPQNGSRCFYFYVNVSQTSDGNTKIVVRDNGKGIDDHKIEIINEMFSRYIESWKRGVYLSSDRLRWSMRLQALFSGEDEEVDPSLTNSYLGWYGLISETDVKNLNSVTVNNFENDYYDGLEVSIELDIT